MARRKVGRAAPIGVDDNSSKVIFRSPTSTFESVVSNIMCWKILAVVLFLGVMHFAAVGADENVAGTPIAPQMRDWTEVYRLAETYSDHIVQTKALEGKTIGQVADEMMRNGYRCVPAASKPVYSAPDEYNQWLSCWRNSADESSKFCNWLAISFLSDLKGWREYTAGSMPKYLDSHFKFHHGNCIMQHPNPTGAEFPLPRGFTDDFPIVSVGADNLSGVLSKAWQSRWTCGFAEGLPPDPTRNDAVVLECQNVHMQNRTCPIELIRMQFEIGDEVESSMWITRFGNAILRSKKETCASV